MVTITKDDLRTALKKTLGKKGVGDKEIDELADYVMSFFGFDDTVVDNKLNSKDRDIFYTLENEGLLKTFRDEVTVKKGKLWRIHYWVLNKDRILKLVTSKEVVEEDKYAVYSDIDEGVWEKHSHMDEKD